jgi:hypothetical protein
MRRSPAQLGFLVLALIGALAAPARAQMFSPELLTELLTELMYREGNARFTFSGYYARWENPFRVRVTRYSDLLGQRVTRGFRLIADTPASPLFEGKYSLNRRLRVGFWYNPIRGERLQKTVRVAENFEPLNLERNTDLGDLHVIYIGPRGLATQFGYYREHGRIRDRTNGTRRDYSLQSWNLWLTQRLDVFLPEQLLSARLDAQAIPFISAGYHPASGMNRAVSILTGIAVIHQERYSLSGTLWLFDVTHPEHTAMRVTGGLVIWF